MKVDVDGNAQPDPVLDDISDGNCPWSPDWKWIACQTPQGLTLVSPNRSQPNKVFTDAYFLAFNWSSDGSAIIGIRVGEVNRSMSLSAIDVRTTRERIITPNLGVLPRLYQPVRGFSRVGDNEFLTSVVHVKSEIWMLEDFPGPPTVFERWFSRLRSAR
jgi:hypothetical protein